MVRIPLKRVGGVFELELHKLALETGTDLVNGSVHSLLAAEVIADLEAPDKWDPTDFSDPLFHSCAVKGKSFLSGSLDLWHRRMRHMSKEDSLSRTCRWV